MSTVFSDGATHTVSASSAGIIASSNTTVDVVSGAAITGTVPPFIDPITGLTVFPTGDDGVTANTGSVVNITGGAVTGGAVAKGQAGFMPAQGISVDDATLMISDGTITGGSTPTQGGVALHVRTRSAVTITGGTFVGAPGTSVGSGGYALLMSMDGSEATGSSLTIRGGSFTSGSCSNYIRSTAAYLLVGGGPVSISGGTFTGGESIGTNVHPTDPSTYQGNSLVLVVLSPGTTVEISGGLYSGRVVLDCRGGSVDFTGTGLVYTIGTMTGALTGTLFGGGTLAGTTSDAVAWVGTLDSEGNLACTFVDGERVAGKLHSDGTLTGSTGDGGTLFGTLSSGRGAGLHPLRPGVTGRHARKRGCHRGRPPLDVPRRFADHHDHLGRGHVQRAELTRGVITLCPAGTPGGKDR